MNIQHIVAWGVLLFSVFGICFLAGYNEGDGITNIVKRAIAFLALMTFAVGIIVSIAWAVVTILGGI